MQNIALLLTILFVLFLIKIDANRKSTVSYALWIPLILMMYSSSRSIGFWLNPTSSTTVDPKSLMEGSPIDRNILSILILVSLYVLNKRKTKWLMIFKNNPLIIIWYLYCGISILWAEFPIVSFKRWMKEIGIFLSVLIVLTEMEPINAVKTLIKRFTYILLPFSILLIVYFPKIGIIPSINPGTNMGSPDYAGVSWNKNSLGAICLVSGLFFIYNLFSIWRIDKATQNKEKVFIQVLFLIIIIYLLGILNSATSSGGLIISCILFMILGIDVINRNIKYITLFIIATFCVGVILQSRYDIVGIFVTSMGRDMTFTGRTFLWKDQLAFHTNPWFGVGYESFWTVKRMLIINLKQSHNGYLKVYLELGVVGLCLLTGVIFQAYRNINKEFNNNFNYWRFRMSMFVLVLITNITEDNIGRMNLIWFVFLLVAIEIPQELQLYNSRKVVSVTSF